MIEHDPPCKGWGSEKRARTKEILKKRETERDARGLRRLGRGWEREGAGVVAKGQGAGRSCRKEVKTQNEGLGGGRVCSGWCGSWMTTRTTPVCSALTQAWAEPSVSVSCLIPATVLYEAGAVLSPFCRREKSGSERCWPKVKCI